MSDEASIKGNRQSFHCLGCGDDLWRGTPESFEDLDVDSVCRAHKTVCRGVPLCPVCKAPVRDHRQDVETHAIYCP